MTLLTWSPFGPDQSLRFLVVNVEAEGGHDDDPPRAMTPAKDAKVLESNLLILKAWSLTVAQSGEVKPKMCCRAGHGILRPEIGRILRCDIRTLMDNIAVLHPETVIRR